MPARLLRASTGNRRFAEDALQERSGAQPNMQYLSVSFCKKHSVSFCKQLFDEIRTQWPFAGALVGALRQEIKFTNSLDPQQGIRMGRGMTIAWQTGGLFHLVGHGRRSLKTQVFTRPKADARRARRHGSHQRQLPRRAALTQSGTDCRALNRLRLPLNPSGDNHGAIHDRQKFRRGAERLGGRPQGYRRDQQSNRCQMAAVVPVRG